MNKPSAVINAFYFWLLVPGLLAGLLLPSTAQAYIDPGTGSLILQAVVGGILAAMVTMKIYWRRLCETLSSFFSRSGDKQ